MGRGGGRCDTALRGILMLNCYIYKSTCLSLLFLNYSCSSNRSEVGFIQTLFIFGFKVALICKILFILPLRLVLSNCRCSEGKGDY